MMKKGWQTVKLGEVMQHEVDAVSVTDLPEFPIAGVYSFARGLFKREALPNTQTTYKFFHRLHKDMFVISTPKAWEGALARVTDEFDGWFLSPVFPTFLANAERLDIKYFEWFCRQAPVWDMLRRKSRGMGARRESVSAQKFLTLEIPLPPLSEQRRIVARIEALARRIAEAQSLRQSAADEANKFLAPVEMRIWPNESLKGAPTLEDVTLYLARGRQSKQGNTSHYLIKTQHVQMGHYLTSKMTLSPEVVNKVKPDALVQFNDVLIACSAAGCLGRVAQYKEKGKAASTDTHVAIARANQQVILPEYLYTYLEGAQGQYQLRSRERGDWQREKIGFRLTELNLADLRRVPIPLPPFDEQRRIVAYLDRIKQEVNELRRLQAESQEELDALLPSVLDRAFKGEL
jgi:type I restriction enzyme S subunit